MGDEEEKSNSEEEVLEIVEDMDMQEMDILVLIDIYGEKY
jgi:hypothetical protein